MASRAVPSTPRADRACGRDPTRVSATRATGRGPVTSDVDYRTRSPLRPGAGHRVGIQNLPAGGPSIPILYQKRLAGAGRHAWLRSQQAILACACACKSRVRRVNFLALVVRVLWKAFPDLALLRGGVAVFRLRHPISPPRARATSCRLVNPGQERVRCLVLGRRSGKWRERHSAS